MRWEMRTRMFLRTSEFLWQEGHTAHATEKEAQEETLKILEIYERFAREYLAIPVITGTKTPDEKFPGAVQTYTIEAMMQDCKAVQAGTSHFLGQNFAKASDIRFQSEEGKDEFAWTTSWGVSTRLIGSLIMTHSDDDGLVIPPKIAPQHIVIQPIYKDKNQREVTLEYCKQLMEGINQNTFCGIKIRCYIDDRDIRGGEKSWQNIKKGVPIRVEVGGKEIEKNQVYFGRRDYAPNQKESMDKNEFIKTVSNILTDIQDSLFTRALNFRNERIKEIKCLDEFRAFFSSETGGFAAVNWCEEAMGHNLLDELKVTPRCIPTEGYEIDGPCIFTNKPATSKVIFAKAY